MEPELFLDKISEQKDLGAVLFTGSSSVFDTIHEKISQNTKNMNTYPRIIGETGGKNFHFIDTECDNMINSIVEKTIESAFNYSGQKCSACSIMYVPTNKLPKITNYFKLRLNYYVRHSENYGLINQKSYDRVNTILDELRSDDKIDFMVNGPDSDYENYLINPQILICEDHQHRVFNEEFFAPILAIYPYQPYKKGRNYRFML